jgi:hypothetical protein
MLWGRHGRNWVQAGISDFDGNDGGCTRGISAKLIALGDIEEIVDVDLT